MGVADPISKPSPILRSPTRTSTNPKSPRVHFIDDLAAAGQCGPTPLSTSTNTAKPNPSAAAQIPTPTSTPATTTTTAAAVAEESKQKTPQQKDQPNPSWGYTYFDNNPYSQNLYYSHNPYNSPYSPYSPPVYQKPAEAMGYYSQNPADGGMCFQPPVPDTTYGPIVHTYIPRFDNGLVVFPQGGGGYPPGYPAAPMMYGQQPGLVPSPMMMPQPSLATHPGYITASAAAMPQVPMAGVAAPAVGGIGGICPPGTPAAGSSLPPDVTGIGKTAGETAYQQMRFAQESNIYAPQDFKPADDDPSRFYPVREVDGAWTQRNRFTIDSLGDCKWFLADEGYFYAVRHPN